MMMGPFLGEKALEYTGLISLKQGIIYCTSMLKKIFYYINLEMAEGVLANAFIGIDDSPTWGLPSGFRIELVKELKLTLPFPPKKHESPMICSLGLFHYRLLG